MSESEFDHYAGNYDLVLERAISVSGEGKEFFAHGRMVWLKDRLRRMGTQPRAALDFGCGTGTSTPYFFDLLGIDSLLGVDVSAQSLDVARETYGGYNARFRVLEDHPPHGEIDLAFCNGVFHHIPPAERLECVRYVVRALKPGGLFAFWENNPWNPGTRYVMSRCEFDADAITLTPPEARGLLQDGGFDVLRTDFLFIFPKSLGALRPLEPKLARWPLGAQYQVLCRKRA